MRDLTAKALVMEEAGATALGCGIHRLFLGGAARIATSTLAEGKGLEPSTGYPATDFESVSSPFGYPPGENDYILACVIRGEK
jgi:hypothetical protein